MSIVSANKNDDNIYDYLGHNKNNMYSNNYIVNKNNDNNDNSDNDNYNNEKKCDSSNNSNDNISSYDTDMNDGDDYVEDNNGVKSSKGKISHYFDSHAPQSSPGLGERRMNINSNQSIVGTISVPFYYLCGYFSLLMSYWL
jgi:hypothetical protein